MEEKLSKKKQKLLQPIEIKEFDQAYINHCGHVHRYLARKQLVFLLETAYFTNRNNQKIQYPRFKWYTEWDGILEEARLKYMKLKDGFAYIPQGNVP